MEDNSNSFNKATQHNLKLHIDNHSLSSSINSQNIEIVTDIKDANITLVSKNDYLISKSDEILDLNNVIVDKKNIKDFIKIIENIFLYNENHTYTQKYIKSTSALDIFNSLFKNYYQHQNLEKLIQFIITKNIFNNFKSFQFYLHSRGDANAHFYETRNKNLSHSRVLVNEFKKYFEIVKKKKNILINPTTDRNLNLNIIGSFIAKVYTYNHLEIVVFASNEELLAPSTEDIKFLNYALDILSLFINKYFKNNLGVDFKKIDIVSISSKKNQKTIETGTLYHNQRIELLGNLLNTLRHELSNPLFGLSLSSEILKDELTNSDDILFLDQIIDSIKRSQDIIGSISDIYIQDNNSIKISIEKFINETLVYCKSEIRGIKSLVTLESSRDEIFISTAPKMLIHVFFNLIINSAQAIKQNKINDGCIAINIKPSDDSIIIHFSDNGPGIPKQIEKDLFNPFITTKETGTGLGLNIVSNLLNKLNGTIVLLQSDVGAKFEIKLPIK